MELINKTANVRRKITNYKSADRYSLASYYQLIIEEFITLKILAKAILNFTQLGNKKLKTFSNYLLYIFSNYYCKYNYIPFIKVSVIKSFIFKEIPKVFTGLL